MKWDDEKVIIKIRVRKYLAGRYLTPHDHVGESAASLLIPIKSSSKMLTGGRPASISSSSASSLSSSSSSSSSSTTGPAEFGDVEKLDL